MSITLPDDLVERSGGRIVLLVMDGLGGLPDPNTGATELETATTPNLDRLARTAALGLLQPAGMGITPGSGPGHLALFGYDPIRYNIGRGVLSALGVGFELRRRRCHAPQFRNSGCAGSSNGSASRAAE